MSTVSSARLRDVLDRLVREQTLSREQAGAVLSAVGSTAEAEVEPRGLWLPRLAEVGGYIGAAFVLASAIVLTGPQWGRFSTSERVAVLGIPALAVLAAAVAIGRAAPRSGPRGRLVAALVLLGGGLLAGVTAVLVDADVQASLIPLTAFAVWAAGYLIRQNPLLHAGTAVAAGFAVALTTVWLFPEDLSGSPWPGWLMLALAVLWLGLTLLQVLQERALGMVVAAALAFIGSEMVISPSDGVHKALGYVALAALAAACLAGYLAVHEVAVLAAGVVALAVVVPQAVIDYTEGAIGAGGALLVTGLSIVGASVLGLRLRRETLDDTPSETPTSHAVTG